MNLEPRGIAMNVDDFHAIKAVERAQERARFIRPSEPIEPVLTSRGIYMEVSSTSEVEPSEQGDLAAELVAHEGGKE